MLNDQEIIRFYQMQLKKFKTLQNKGIHVTEFGTRISFTLIEATQRRLDELRKITDIEIRLRPIAPSTNGEANGRFL